MDKLIIEYRILQAEEQFLPSIINDIVAEYEAKMCSVYPTLTVELSEKFWEHGLIKQTVTLTAKEINTMELGYRLTKSNPYTIKYEHVKVEL